MKKKTSNGVEVTELPTTGIYSATRYRAVNKEGWRFIIQEMIDSHQTLKDWRTVAKSLRSIKSADVTPLIEDDPRLRKASAEAAERRRVSAKRIRIHLTGIEAAIARGDDPAEIAARAYWLGREVERFNVLDFEPFAAESRKVSGKRGNKGERNAKRNDQWREAAKTIRQEAGHLTKASLIRKVLSRVEGITDPTKADEKRVRRVLFTPSRG